MLAFYLDQALTKVVSRATPKRFLVPTTGGSKTASLWLGDPAEGITYVFGGNIAIRPFGASPQLLVSLKRSTDSTYGFPGTPILYATDDLESGVAHALRVDLQIDVRAGDLAEFIDWGLETNGYLSSADEPDAPLTVAQADGYVLRRNQALPQRLRTLPLEREVAPTLPGFKVGEYRWRDWNAINAKALVPSKWDLDVGAIGLEKFIAGIGDNDDLKPEQVEEVDDSLYLRIQHGHYFTGPKGYFLPAQPELEILPAHTLTHGLAHTPRTGVPVFVGTYALDGQGFYETATEFRRIVSVPTDDPGYDWFHLNAASQQLTVSRTLDRRVLFLGTLSGNATDYFDVPVYPVDKVRRVYLDRGLGNTPLECFNTRFDREQGTVVVPKPDGGLIGEPVYAEVDAAIAVLYETGTDHTRSLPVDINPAFAGIAGGFIYLQHRRQKPESIVLACDKPLIAIPSTHDSIIGLIAYGPVYFDGDYALLTATAYSKVPGEVVPGARLRVVVDPTSFTGLINYRDPLVETSIDVVTGGDGTANLIFLPKTGFGAYLPAATATGSGGGRATTTITNDTLVLPTGVPISQLRNNTEGWLVTAYAVYNTNPLFGLVDGDPTRGEVVWRTVGTPGLADYRTNGMRDAWRTGQTPIRPLQALDANGVNYDQPAFTGTVKKLVFGQAVPVGTAIGAYFITYVQRVTLQLQVVDSNVISNTILLEMAVPSVIVENPWLIIEDGTQGRLNQYRLGWQSHTPLTL